MNARRVNFEYLNLYKEIPLFCALYLRTPMRSKPEKATGRILIANTCLVGEFAASVPAIRDFIVRNPGIIVDLLVSPPLRPIAERVRGIGRVYTARSLYGRRTEVEHPVAQEKLGAYDKIFVMRISTDVYRLIRNVHAGEIHTGLKQYSGYAIHLWASLLHRRRPKQWIELNFEMLDGTPKNLSFEDIFDCTEADYAEVGAMDALQTTQKKVIIHTGASWPMKHWDTRKWIELLRKARQLGDMRFIFVGGAEDGAEYARIAAELDFPIYSLIGKIDLMRLLIVLRSSDYFVGVDSGPRNLAHLADVRSVSIFGPGPHFYMPLDARDIVIDKSRGRGLLQMFFYSRNAFIDRITADEVYDAFKKLWSS